MTVSKLYATARNDFRLTSGFEWWDPDAGCTLVMSQPSVDRELWMDYLKAHSAATAGMGLIGR